MLRKCWVSTRVARAPKAGNLCGSATGGVAHRRLRSWEPLMGELAVFRELLRAHRRGAGRSQGQLATAIGLHPNVLSHKLNAHGRSVLTTPEVVGIVTTLAGWG